MSVERQQAIDYLRAPAEGFWRWAEEGQVLVWHDGGTLAFRQEVEGILEWLAPNGLPPFGAIALLLAATKGSFPDLDDIHGSPEGLPIGAPPEAAVLRSARGQLRQRLEESLQQLTKLEHLPGELRRGHRARCVLAEAVFEPTKKERFANGETILRGMREPMTDQDLIQHHPFPPDERRRFIEQIQLLATGLRPHTAESLALRLKTGLDALPEGAEMEADLAPAERVRRLIEELSRDRELGAVARAARELMAAVRLPRRLAQREQLAIGGVSDITNRGSLDRLLLSELAHDDLTLSLRVALNEALYLRREPPMREPPGALHLLLDSGIRLWGVPRVLATAVALALVARDPQKSAVRAWRPSGRKLVATDLVSRDGLTRHLAALEIDEHPGDSLETFMEEADERNQSVLITHRDTLDDPAFRSTLASHPNAPDFVASVDHDGRFELHPLPLAHRPPVCQARLNLGSILGEKPAVPLFDEPLDINLPAIHQVRPFPLLLPLGGKPVVWSRGGDGLTHALMTNQRLVAFRDNLQGGTILAHQLPAGKASWIECVEAVVHLVKLGRRKRPPQLLSFPLPRGPIRVVDLEPDLHVLDVHRYGGVILVIGHGMVLAYALSDGRLLERVTPPHPHQSRRFYRGEGSFFFASWDGESIQFEKVSLPTDVVFGGVRQIFDREGDEGPWILLGSGAVVCTATGRKLQPAPTGKGVVYEQVSRDGHRIVIGQDGHLSRRIYSLLSGETVPTGGFPPRGLEDEPLVPVWNLMRVVKMIAGMRDGIALLGRKNRWRKLCLTAPDQLGITDLRPGELEGLKQIPFERRIKFEQEGGSFRVAAWPNGSQAFLDSNGGLHLKSHDPEIAEVSLLLSDGAVAGWTSAFDSCGPSFFLASQHHSHPAAVFRRLMQFVNNL